MNAQFKLSADLEIHIDPDRVNQTARVSIIRGVCYEAGHPSHVLPPEGNAGTEAVHGCPEKTVDAISLSKNEARAIASALMGCAAQLP